MSIALILFKIGVVIFFIMIIAWLQYNFTGNYTAERIFNVTLKILIGLAIIIAIIV